ncbi:MAG: hypothetical protein MJZ61_00325 [Bacteroidales bacterium]|nr:hypothetical protein [Bacteroidales bacterium]
MKLRPFVLAALIAFMGSCSSTQNFAKVTQQADLLYYQKDYSDAFEAYSKVIENYTSKHQAVPGNVYLQAGKSLYYSGSKQQAMEYFVRGEDVGATDEESLLLRIKYYGSIDNMSKELDCLERYAALYDDGSEAAFVNKRLFLRYVEMKEYRKAYLKFSSMDEADKDDIEILEKYFTVCEKSDKKAEADKTAQLLYNLNPNNLIGLNYVAYNAYITTENEYVAAIKAYEAKKTQASYKVMQQKTAPLAARYKTAKNYYVKLYNLYKRPHDAEILARICTRLNDKKTAAYYEKLAKKK